LLYLCVLNKNQKRMKKIKLLLLAVLLVFGTMSINAQTKWDVPAKYQTMKNPIAAKTDAAIGKSLYTKHCKACHGTEGYGDGVKAKDMKGDLGDFSSKKFQAQTDGALFYKTSFGRNDMPEYTKKVPSNEDRWLIVNYMRTLKE